MTPPCTHGCADPRMCPDCRAATHHTDPDIRAAWREARDALAAMLRPWVVTHKVDDLAQAYIDGLEARGWRPPLRPPRPAPPPAAAAGPSAEYLAAKAAITGTDQEQT